MGRYKIHRSHRTGWLRAGFLGANDGIRFNSVSYYRRSINSGNAHL